MSEAPVQKQVLIKEGLVKWTTDGPRLAASQCRDCGEVTFPANWFCPQCCRETTEEIVLSPKGTLHSFTVQRFKPPPPYRGPDPFVPYGVGMIELPEGVRITSVLADCDVDALSVGMPMELVVTEFFTNEAGDAVLGYKFRAVRL